VIIDFGEDLLWWLRPESDASWSCLISIERVKWVNFHSQPNSSELDAFIKKYGDVLSESGAYPSLGSYYHFKE
jgi:hypothetical protein